MTPVAPPDGPWVWCGAERLPVPRADAWVAPARGEPLPSLAAALAAACDAPCGAPRLEELARGRRRVVVAVPDTSRPCPTPAVLGHLLERLAAAGLTPSQVEVLIGCGLHATTDEATRRALVGPALAGEVAVAAAQGLTTPCVDLGTTPEGAPVRVARAVAEADLAVTVGVVEPHLYAGFSGGVKGVAIGCAGRETIAWTHHPRFISRPGVAVGALAGNPFQACLRAIAARTPLAWGVNVVVGDGHRPLAVAAGDPVAAQEALVRAAGSAWLRTVEGPFDVLVLGVPRPKSRSLYQASRAATYAALCPRPALREGGLLVLCADLADGDGDGPGERNGLAVLAAAASVDGLVRRGLAEDLGPGSQRAFVLARTLQRFRLAVVGAGAAAVAPLAHLGVAAVDSVAAAVAAHERRLGRRARVLAVADAIATVPALGWPGAEA